MNNKSAIHQLDIIRQHLTYADDVNAIKYAITALELMDTLIDRPCSACRYHKENGCCKWNCVFDGHIGKKVSE